ncbi:MAG TPA: VOC family protein [Candidatus Limnocylindria bacterium]|nr:VOC family protein [Candidatus Limnocylindria bacterium]
MTDGPRLGALIDLLDRHGVAFVIGGSVGALAHGASGVQPGDLDVIPATDPENLRRLAAALAELEAVAQPTTGRWVIEEGSGEHRWVDDGVERPIAPHDPGDADTFDHSFDTTLGRLDVVPRIAGRHEDLRRRAARLAVDGREAWVAAPIDLLAGMTAARRPKDALRVRHLRSVARPTEGVGFVGLRTHRYEEMVSLFRDRIGLSIIHEGPGATWFRLGADAELHVYADTDPDHAFFTTGPVVGLRVADVDAMRSILEADGMRMLTDVERTAGAAWCHFEAPDGTVLEIIGPGPG